VPFEIRRGQEFSHVIEELQSLPESRHSLSPSSPFKCVFCSIAPQPRTTTPSKTTPLTLDLAAPAQQRCGLVFCKRALAANPVTPAVAPQTESRNLPCPSSLGETGQGMMLLRKAAPMPIKHCCTSCGEIICEHVNGSWAEIKRCGSSGLCASCKSFGPSARADAARKETSDGNVS
jgi:hypothetical protein